MKRPPKVVSPPQWTPRTVQEILTAPALESSLMSRQQLVEEHEHLRRTLETAQAQINLWAKIVAWRHRCPKCKEARLFCPTCGDPW